MYVKQGLTVVRPLFGVYGTFAGGRELLLRPLLKEVVQFIKAFLVFGREH